MNVSCTLEKKYVFGNCWVRCSINVSQVMFRFFQSSIFLLISYLPLLSFSFRFYQIHFKYLRTQLLEPFTFRIIVSSWWTDPFNHSLLSLLLSSSSDCNTTIPASLLHCILFHLLHPPYEDLWDYIRPTQIIHDYPLIQKYCFTLTCTLFCHTR